MSMSSPESGGSSGVFWAGGGVLIWVCPALGGDGEARWARARTAVLLGIVCGLPKVGGKNWDLLGGRAWGGVPGGEGEFGALRLFFGRSIGVRGLGVLGEGSYS